MQGIDRDRWLEIEALLDEVLAQPPEQRAGFLDRRCSDDPLLHRQVAALLEAGGRTHPLLDASRQPLLAVLSSHTGTHDTVPEAIHEPGERIGSYEIIEELARGGMGTVFLARRADGHFDQQVALKLIRPGMDSQAVLRRFLAERQILARLRHPNIARLLDGGMTADAEPFFVMEFIDGLPLTRYCDEHRLSVDERLRLFQQVGQAVHYAHRNLVIHRDIKPANILVNHEREVKLLDFGIARLLSQQDDPAQASLTHTGLQLLTPAYAAPEQVRGEAITTATDVYALGVLLYELLTGHRPYRLSGSVSWQEVICSTEPEPPSTTVTRAQWQRQADGTLREVPPEFVSQLRGTQAERLRRRLAGDLDTMVLMALRKEPERRYGSVDQFIEDIERHLAGLPVRAERDTVGYRTRKFVRRHRVGVAASLALLVLLVLVSVLAVRHAVVTARQSRQIVEEAAKSQQVKDFVVGLFAMSDPARSRGEEVTARSLLERGVGQVEGLSGQPVIQAEMLHVMGVVYRQLGLYEQARPLLERSLSLRRSVWGPEHTDVAASVHDLAWLLDDLGEYAEAERLYREALELRIKLLGEEHVDVAASMNDLGVVLVNQGNYEEAESLLRQALAMRRRLCGEEHPDIAESLNNLGWLMDRLGAYERAEPFHYKALELRRQLLGNEHPSVVQSLINLSSVLKSRGRYDEAENLLREALALGRKVMGNEHPAVIRSLATLGSLLYSRKAYDEAEPIHREVLSLRRELFGEKHPLVALALNNLGTVRYQKGAYREADALFQQALAIWREAYGSEHLDISYSLNWMARVRHRRGRLDEAERLFREALAMRRKLLGHADPRVAPSLMGLSAVLLDKNLPGEAEPLLREVQQIHEADGSLHGYDSARLLLGRCLTALLRFEEAEALLLESYAENRAASDAGRIEDAREALSELYSAWGKPAQAELYGTTAAPNEMP